MYNFCYLYFLIVELVPYLSFKNITSIGMIHETVIIVSADTGILQRLINCPFAKSRCLPLLRLLGYCNFWYVALGDKIVETLLSW